MAAIFLWDVLPKLLWRVVLAHLILFLLGETLATSKSNQNYFKKFIQKKSHLPCVQLAWKTCLYDPKKITPLIRSLTLTLNQITEVPS